MGKIFSAVTIIVIIDGVDDGDDILDTVFVFGVLRFLRLLSSN